ncbi:MAG: hypothetical protein QOI35_1693 [Cryptosporangiaceae bacterium]|jgi:hypothetical protein|nr:hypothetical protein [Cryptosporangiaceae bacterium]MDQ1656917.1 hypothetical protein [Cryptosporangiaceae bacterium]
MRSPARSLAASAVLAATLLSAAGCFWNDTTTDTQAAGTTSSKPADDSAGQPSAAQTPRPGSEPLFHSTSATEGKFHEFETEGGFLVRFACKGAGTASVSLGSGKKFDYKCTPAAPEQQNQLVAPKQGRNTYRVEVTTSNPKTTWSLFLDRSLTR